MLYFNYFHSHKQFVHVKSFVPIGQEIPFVSLNQKNGNLALQEAKLKKPHGYTGVDFVIPHFKVKV